MLQSIRDGSQGWITWIVVGLICITFIAIGGTSFMNSQSDDVVAKVEGRSIKKWEVEKLAKRMVSQNPNTNAQQPIDLNRARIQALKALTENIILVNVAKKQGFKVNAQQVVHFLNTVPDFQEKGRFSFEKYKNILAHLEYTDSEFRNEIQNAILIDQVRQAFQNTSFKMPQEIARAISFENQRRDFDFLIIKNSLFNKEIKLSNADIEAYYKNHVNQFLTQKKVKVEYLELKLTDMALEDVFSKKADELIKLTYDHPDSLLPAADQLGLTVQHSPWLTKQHDSNLVAPFNNPKVFEAAFSEEVSYALSPRADCSTTIGTK